MTLFIVMPSVDMVNVIFLSTIMRFFIMSAVVLSAVKLSAVMLSVVEPYPNHIFKDLTIETLSYISQENFLNFI